MLRALAAALAVFALIAAGCGQDDDGDPSSGGDGNGSAAPQAETETEAAQGSGCRDVEAPQPKPDGGQKKPKGKLADGKKYVVRMETSCGSFSFTLDQEASPNTAASFAALVEKGFFDGLVFHRIVPGFVIQGGDPTGTGTGGPGYTTIDPPPSDAAYVKGVVAMAKAGNEPPGASGSQFYVVTGADVGLPPEYALLGEVTKGIEVIDLIGQQGDPATEQPLQPIVIEKATLQES